MNWLFDPYDWWIRPFVEVDFLRDTLWAGLLTVLCTSVIGTWVVLRGLSFLGDALAHGVLPGIAVAFVLGQNTTVGALVAAFAMVLGVQLVRASSPLPDDASIGVLFVGFLALAVVIMSSGRATGAGDLTRFLFGSITAVSGDDLVTLAVVTSIVLIGVALLHRAFVVGPFDPTQAAHLGVRPALAPLALVVL
ncbi:MAG: metal ABC transporter permease, partial [Ilumatobacteraceae bacterium]